MLTSLARENTYAPTVPHVARHPTAEGLQDTEDNSQHAWAEGTHTVYRKHIQHFARWCEQEGLCRMPAAPLTIEAYFTERAEHVCISTILIAAAAIQAHTSKTTSPHR